MKPARLGCALFALLVLVSDLQAGVIRGTVVAPKSYGRDASRKAPARRVKAARLQDTVVYVDLPPALQRKMARKWGQPKVVQREQQFAPRVLAVAAGTTVQFQNRDQVYHNVFSVSPAMRFDVGKYRPQQSKKVRFQQPGLVNLHCDIHPGMSGFILVLPHRVFVQADSLGAFSLPKLPQGKYSVKAWHPKFGERLLPAIEVLEKGEVQVSLRL